MGSRLNLVFSISRLLLFSFTFTKTDPESRRKLNRQNHKKFVPSLHICTQPTAARPPRPARPARQWHSFYS